MKKIIYVVLTVVFLLVGVVMMPTFKSEKTPLFPQEETLCEVTVLSKPADMNVSWIKSGIPTHFVRNVFTTETGKKYHCKNHYRVCYLNDRRIQSRVTFAYTIL